MDTLLQLEMSFDVYAFDFFDTLIYREIEPEHVKKLWAKEIQNIFQLDIDAKNLYLIRNKYETELCERNLNQGKDLEFQYKELINLILKQLDNNSINKERFYEISYQEELKIEIRNQHVFSEIIEVLKELQNKGKKIICISDFYMEKKFLEQLMIHHKINKFFDDIFVSSEYLCTKRSGKLYDVVVKKLGYSSQKIIMIGDNINSDFNMAESKGINAYWLDRSLQMKYYQEFKESHVSSNVEKLLLDLSKNIDRNNYEDISFTLYYFIEKLYYSLLKDNVKNVFFLSREGEFLKKIFDTYQLKHNLYTEKIQTHYLMVSRKSTLMPSLKTLSQENFEIIFRQYVNISLFDFLSSLGFETDEQNKLGRILNADIYEKQTDLPNTELYQKLITNEYFISLYERKRKIQHNNFKRYLNSFGVDFAYEGMYLVDVGWKGTIQDNIFKFFNEEYKIFGLYIGLVAPGKEHIKNIKKGLIFENIDYKTKFFNIYNENKSIFEVILGASHGSASSYDLKNNNIEVLTSEKVEESELFHNLIMPIQKKIYKVFNRIDNLLINEFYTIDNISSVWADIHAKLVFLPTKKQVELFYQIYHFENFGIFEFTKFKTNKKIGLIKRIKNLFSLIKLRHKFFLNSFWGVIALKDAGLSILSKLYGNYMYKRFYIEEREQ